MKILVYPHDLNMGGSQTNAIELAAAVTRLGHECIVFGRRGSLCERIEELGLEFVESPDPGRRPSLRIARALRALVAERGIDIVHGYEWPPGLEAAMAVERMPGVAAVCTVMSMAVAPFLPRGLPLVVGTQQISAREQIAGRYRVCLIEPPVDLAHNSAVALADVAAFRERWAPADLPTVVCVSRLVRELKSEGILTAIEAVGASVGTSPYQLVIVGDGAARPELERAADRVNAQAGRRLVAFTGELRDPRPAYAAADIVLGMGGSALRALAFGKPLIVQGEQGYFRRLTAQSLDEFRWQGWYGIGEGREHGMRALRDALRPLLHDPALRDECGRFGRRVVEDFSLENAARRQVTVYRDALAATDRASVHAVDAVRSFAGLARYHVTQRVARWRGTQRTDDFNADLANDVPKRAVRAETEDASDGPLLYFPGVGWDTLAGTDRQLATALAEERTVIWVDTPHSILRRRDRVLPLISRPHPHIVRLRAPVLAGVQRPGLRGLANRRRAQVARRFLAASGVVPAAIIASTTAPMLDLVQGIGGVRVYYATDDYVEAAPMWGVDPRYLGRSRERNLAAADLVLAVTDELGRHLQRGPVAPRRLPNGADVSRFVDVEAVSPAEVALAPPVAGVVGQFNARTDLELLFAVQRARVSLLLVGPRWFTDAADEASFERLIALPGVHWVDAVPRERIAPYLRAMDVGLTPYRDSMFNRRSHPLKTVEYLAAGLRVVASDVAPMADLDPRFAVSADRPATFVEQVVEQTRAAPDRGAVRASAVTESWEARAVQLLSWLGRGSR